MVLELFPTVRGGSGCGRSRIRQRRFRAPWIFRIGRSANGDRSNVVIEIRGVTFLDEVALLWLVFVLCSRRQVRSFGLLVPRTVRRSFSSGTAVGFRITLTLEQLLLLLSSFAPRTASRRLWHDSRRLLPSFSFVRPASVTLARSVTLENQGLQWYCA